MVLSTLSNVPMERVATTLQGFQSGTGWFQLYWPNDNEVALSLVRRAEQAGYEALVVTLDTWTLAWRPRDLANGYLPFLNGAGLANYLSDPVFRSRLKESPEEHPEAALALWSTIFNNPGIRARDLAWLKEHTSLPVIVKGVCHPDDARMAFDAGLDGVIVSNHGGRQIDGARAALDCLAAVVSASGDMTVLFDSGIRTGSDILKALALGARAVLIGRPYVFGLAVAGGTGVGHVLRCLLAELDLTLGLSGHAAIGELSPDSLVQARPG
jgi:isopentenyl diphosphate isomerase/L-lactate dehydrogenase-like FMN-dependent dehydrogenase